MENMMKSISRLSKFLFEFCNLNVVIFESEGVISNHSCISFPEILGEHVKNVHSYLIEKLIVSENVQHYHYIDSFNMHFICLSTKATESCEIYTIIGPFLTELPSGVFIDNILDRNNIPITAKSMLKSFLNCLMIFSKSKLDSVYHLIESMTGIDCNNDTIESYTQAHASVDVDFNKYKHTNDSIAFLKNIEKRYQAENKLIEAVRSGDIEVCQNLFFNKVSALNMPYRIPQDPLRSSKNSYVILNTILRKSAEKGGVHPYYVDLISTKYSISIEQCGSLSELGQLANEMIIKYCTAVKKYSIVGYSYIVRETINYVNFNFALKLSITDIAKQLHVSHSHLARQFKQEMKMTFTEFVHSKRVSEAKVLLEFSSNTIAEISAKVGFEDINYFSRIFKKIEGETPTSYRYKYINGVLNSYVRIYLIDLC